mmetsp:Transcript_46710/g.118385  ORF Transcript_46710/g.118385 Transcript_46710/m.118385 type:complete len:362 (+) Transcript_46710:1008-2093(+)
MPSCEEVVGLELRRASGAAEDSRSTRTPDTCLCGCRRALLQQRHRLSEHLAGVILRENRNRLGDGLRLGSASLAALLHLRVEVVASQLQVAEELDVLRALCAGVLQILLGVRESLRVARILCLHLVELLLAHLDLGRLGGRECLEVFLSLQILLLRSAELALELLEHLVQDTVNAGGTARRAGLVDRLVLMDLQEGPRGRRGLCGLRDDAGGELGGQFGDGAAMHVESSEEGSSLAVLVSAGEAPFGPERQKRLRLEALAAALGVARHEHLILQRRIPEQHAHAVEHPALELEEGLGALVFGQHRDSVAQVGHGLHHVLLLLTELACILLPDLRCLRECLGVLLDFLFRLLDRGSKLAELR